jgi:hypothetical protein
MLNRDGLATDVSSDAIYRLVREAAYLKAEARNFVPGVELDDWLQAEKEVLERLGIGPGAGAK